MGRKWLWQRVPEILRAHGCGREKSFHQSRPPGRTDPHLHFDSESCVGMLCSLFCQYPRNESRNLCSQQHGLLQNEHSQGSAGRDGKQHTHCRLQLRKNHHRQKNYHQPRTGQAKFHICYVQAKGRGQALELDNAQSYRAH